MDLTEPYSKTLAKSYAKNIHDSNTTSCKIPEEIEDIAQNLIEKRDYENDRIIFRQYAPYSFMEIYKYEIYDIARACEYANFDSRDFILTLARFEGRLPLDEYFF